MSDAHYTLRRKDQVGFRPASRFSLERAFIKSSLIGALLSCSPVPSVETASQVSSIPTQSDIDALGLDLELIVTYEDDIQESSFSVPSSILYNDEYVELPHDVVNFTNRTDPPLRYVVSITGGENSSCQNTPFLAQDAEELAAPASITKVATMYVTALIMAQENIDFNLGTNIEITRTAISDAEDLKSFDSLENGQVDNISMYFALKGIGTRSDGILPSAIAISAGRALGWEGTDEMVLAQFVNRMNQVAQHLGMNSTGFVNVTGDNGNYTNAQDFNKLIEAFERDFPRTFRLAMGSSQVAFPRALTGNNDHTSHIVRRHPKSARIKTGTLQLAGYTESGTIDISHNYRMNLTILGGDGRSANADLADRFISVSSSINFENFCSSQRPSMTLAQAERNDLSQFRLALVN